MRSRRLGSSGISVSEVGLGGNTFGPPRLDEATSVRVLHAALDMDVSLVDTAVVYGQGLSEDHIGRALEGRRDRMVIATKFHLGELGDQSIRERVREHLETSLRRLRTDRVDLYQLHAPMPEPDPAELLEALGELVDEGKVVAIGVCNYSSWRLAETVTLARERGLAAPATVQNYYNLFARQTEQEVLPCCRRFGIGVLPYHPLGGGFLTGK